VISVEKTVFHLDTKKWRRTRRNKQSRTWSSFSISKAEDESRETLLKESRDLLADSIARNEKDKKRGSAVYFFFRSALILGFFAMSEGVLPSAID
jgi:hypothetical protein